MSEWITEKFMGQIGEQHKEIAALKDENRKLKREIRRRPPRIVGVAMEFEDEAGMLCLPAPHRHCHLVALAKAIGVDRMRSAKATQGFYTSEGQFVTRFQAGAVAKNAGQTKERKKELFSEDVW